MKLNKAFTLPETIMVLVVLGFFAILAVYHLAPSKSFNERKIITQSHTFYGEIEAVFQNILANKASGDITKIEDSNGDSKIDSIDLKNHFSKYMQGIDLDCSYVKLQTEYIKDFTKNAACAEFEPDVKAAFYLDTTCKTSAFAYEFLEKDENLEKAHDDTCGYIIYGFRGAKGVLGEDIFIIPFSKRKLL